MNTISIRESEEYIYLTDRYSLYFLQNITKVILNRKIPSYILSDPDQCQYIMRTKG